MFQKVVVEDVQLCCIEFCCGKQVDYFVCIYCIIDYLLYCGVNVGGIIVLIFCWFVFVGELFVDYCGYMLEEGQVWGDVLCFFLWYGKCKCCCQLFYYVVEVLLVCFIVYGVFYVQYVIDCI